MMLQFLYFLSYLFLFIFLGFLILRDGWMVKLSVNEYILMIFSFIFGDSLQCESLSC